MNIEVLVVSMHLIMLCHYTEYNLTNHRVSVPCHVSKFSKVRKAVYQPLITLRTDNKFILVLESMNISDLPWDKQYCLGCSVCHCQWTANTVIAAYTPCLDIALSTIKCNATWFAFSLQCPLGLVLHIYFPANRPLLWQTSICW